METASTLKRTPFYELHKQFGAKLIDFGGFEMPVQYEGIIAEHKAVRTGVGVFDVSHMGEIEVRGENALAYLQHLTTNDVSKLTVGQAQYSSFCYEHGGMVDDLIVYRMPDHYFLIVNASNKDKDFDWMKKNLTAGVELNDLSDELSLLAVQGPKAIATLQKLTEVVLDEVKYYHFTHGRLAGVEMLLSRTGYTGEAGYELCFPNEFGAKVWEAVFAAGKEFGIKPVGLGARDTLRTEMGYSLYGHEIDQTRNPIEAGLGWITKFDKSDFIGRSVLEQIKKSPKEKLVGLVMTGKSIPRQGFDVVDASGKKIGVVCSGTQGPSVGKAIATAYVAIPHSVLGTKVFVSIRGKSEEAEVVKLPFWQKK